MTILYLSDQDLDNGSGVSRKILAQVRAWEKENHRVVLVSTASLTFFTSAGERIGIPHLRIQRRGWRIFAHLLVGTWRLRRLLHDVSFDLVYTRYRLYAPFFRNALKNRPLVVEINSDDRREYRSSSVLLAGYNRLFRRFFLQDADGFVCVSRELSKTFCIRGKPCAVLANGADVSSIPFMPSVSNPRPTFVFIGSAGQPWHGVDKIVAMAQSMKAFDFHVVGTEGASTDNLFFHGFLDAREHQLLVGSCDIGIGSLALHRIGMHEASPLKTRQYLAQGLPVLYAYDDTDLASKEPFALCLPNTEDNVQTHAEAIAAFALKVWNDAQVRHQAREFAMKHLDVSVKERIRLEFFRKVLG